MHCSPQVLTCLLLCCFSLKAFETLAREIVKPRHLTGANVEAILVKVHTYNTSVLHHMHMQGGM